MELTKERAAEIGSSIFNIRLWLSMIKVEELEEVIRQADKDMAIGPLIDPTKWRDEDLFSSVAKTVKVCRQIIDLKKEVEGETTQSQDRRGKGPRGQGDGQV